MLSKKFYLIFALTLLAGLLLAACGGSASPAPAATEATEAAAADQSAAPADQSAASAGASGGPMLLIRPTAAMRCGRKRAQARA